MAQKKSKVHKFPLVGKKYRTSYYDQSGDRQYITHADEHELMRMKIAAQEEVAEGRHTSAKDAGTLTEAFNNFHKNRSEKKDLDPDYVIALKGKWDHCLSQIKVDGKLIASINIKQFAKRKLLIACGEQIENFQIAKGNELRYAAANFGCLKAIVNHAIAQEHCPPVDRVIWKTADIDWKKRQDTRVKIPPIDSVRRLIEAAELWDRDGRQDKPHSDTPRTINTIDADDGERRRRHYERIGHKPTPYGLIFRCLGQIGCRPSELRGLPLCRDATDPNQIGLITNSNNPGVRLQQRAHRKGSLGNLKTRNAYRFVPIGPDLAARLQAHVERENIQPGELVFSTAKGNPLNDDGWRKRLHEICEFHDITWYEAIYTLRHVCASMWIKQGRNIKWISVRMGHQTAAFTLDTYGHLWDEDDEDAAAAVDTENMLYGSAVAAE